MKEELKFKSIVAQYCQVTPENMSGELRFREDLGFSSLDFMSMLGELEDEFDIELEADKIIHIHTINEAMDMIKSLEVAV